MEVGDNDEVKGKCFSALRAVRDRVVSQINEIDKTNEIKTDYNYCVIQYYPKGSTNMKPHSDEEVEEEYAIAGVSLGSSTRKLKLRLARSRKTEHVQELLPRSAYYLLPPTNDHFTHQILPSHREDDNSERWSLNFRHGTNLTTKKI